MGYKRRLAEESVNSNPEKRLGSGTAELRVDGDASWWLLCQALVVDSRSALAVRIINDSQFSLNGVTLYVGAPQSTRYCSLHHGTSRTVFSSTPTAIARTLLILRARQRRCSLTCFSTRRGVGVECNFIRIQPWKCSAIGRLGSASWHSALAAPNTV